MRLFNFPDEDSDHVARLQKSFKEAEPFPHVVLHDVLTVPVADVLAAYPSFTWAGWRSRANSYEAGKRFCADIELIPDLPRQMIYELMTPRFLQFVSRVTAIDALIPDPYLGGGGLHCSGPVGKLVAHTDVHLYPELKLFRQINVLLYLNPDWNSGDGGELQLYKKGSEEPVVSIPPAFGTCVIFRTDHDSVHGVSKVSEGANPRRSIAMYYYTSTESRRFSGDTAVHWQGGAPSNLTGLRRSQLAVSRALSFAGQAIGHLGYLVNPIYREERGNREQVNAS